MKYKEQCTRLNEKSFQTNSVIHVASASAKVPQRSTSIDKSEKDSAELAFRPRIHADCARHLAAVLAAQQLIVKSCTVKAQDGAFQCSIDVQIDWRTIYLAQSLNFVQRAVWELYILLGSMDGIRHRSA